MFNKYYEEELRNLRQLAVEFSKAHPVAAPMLSGPTTDPDVERLLQGVAFLTGLLHQKMRTDFPKIIIELMGLIFPHYTKPLPSSAVIVCEPKPNVMEIIKVKQGTTVASKPVDGTSCMFQTLFEIDIHPVLRKSIRLTHMTNKKVRISLLLELTNINLQNWHPQNLCLFIGGSYSQFTDIFMLMDSFLEKIILRPADGGTECVLPPSDLKSIGFDKKHSFLEFPIQSFTAYRFLQEYFVMPRRFTFMELVGWEKWVDRGKGRQFEIIFEFDNVPIKEIQVTDNTFILNAVPVVNIFRFEMDPIVFDHKTDKIKVQPSVRNPEHYRIYDIYKLESFEQGTVNRREYVPAYSFGDFSKDKYAYRMVRARSVVNNEPEVFLDFVYPPGSPEPREEVFSITALCTNGNLPESLQIGDISVPTFESPEMLTFRNITNPAFAMEPLSDENAPWRMFSHLSLNYLSLADKDNLKELLSLYNSTEDRDKARFSANAKRIEGIIDLNVTPVERLMHGTIVRGQNIEMSVRRDCFAGLGDIYMFGCVMDRFFSAYCSINTFTQFSIHEVQTGETFKWKARIGERFLI